MSAHNRPEFVINFDIKNTRVWIDGVELRGVREVKVHQPLALAPIVTIEFVASSVNKSKESSE
jgi:hypothetical protein